MTHPPTARYGKISWMISPGHPWTSGCEDYHISWTRFWGAGHYLLESLQRAIKPQARDFYLGRILEAQEHIHYNDRKNIVSCLEKGTYLDGTRKIALRILARRKESKKLFERIETLVDDQKRNPEVKNLLEEIKSQE